MKRNIVVLSLLTLLFSVAQIDGEENEPDKSETKKISFWMKKKLELSQEILHGLAEADYDGIDKSAHTMQTLNRIEGWVRRHDSKQYRQQLGVFKQATEDLIEHAEDENLEGATLAFTKMTFSCVACHQHLREPHRNESKAEK